jgi:hypothetical protein
MTREEILSAIAKTDKVINNPTMPEAVKQVAIDTRAKYQAQLDAMGGEEPKVEKEEVVETEVEKEVEKEVVAPKKERVKFERKPRTPKAPTPKKEEETPESKAEKSMEGKKLTVANCRELLAKLKTRREGAKKRVATRKKQGKPAELTTIEVLKKASDNLEKKVETEVNKDGKLQKTTITRSTKEVVDIVATIISGIPTKAERTEYINEVIADLKKLIDKVEPITEKMAKGGEIGQELMGGQPNQKKPSGAILLEVRKNGKEIVVTEDDGKTKELYVKSNGFSGYTLHYKGNQYEFAYSLDSYAKGGIFSKGPLEFKNRIMGSQGNYTYSLNFQPRTNRTTLYINDDENGNSKQFRNIHYTIIEEFANAFQYTMDSEDEFTESDWSFEYKLKSAHLENEDMKYGASSDSGTFNIFIGNESYTFESASLMQGLAESFIELYEQVGEEGYEDEEDYAKGGKIKVGDTIYKAWFKNPADSSEKFYKVYVNAKSKVEAENKAKLIDGENFVHVSTPQTIFGEYQIRDIKSDSTPIYAKGGMMSNGGIINEETKYKIDNGFTKKSFNEILNELFPYNFGFKVFKPLNRQNILTPNYDEAPSVLYGYDDSQIKSRLHFDQYKRDHAINFAVEQGGENTYFYFLIGDEKGNEYVGTFGFKDLGDVDSSYVTRFIAFLMECYGLPFEVKHSVMAKGGITKDFSGNYYSTNDFVQQNGLEEEAVKVFGEDWEAEDDVDQIAELANHMGLKYVIKYAETRNQWNKLRQIDTYHKTPDSEYDIFVISNENWKKYLNK